jgi:hypothetical protein
MIPQQLSGAYDAADHLTLRHKKGMPLHKTAQAFLQKQLLYSVIDSSLY